MVHVLGGHAAGPCAARGPPSHTLDILHDPPRFLRCREPAWLRLLAASSAQNHRGRAGGQGNPVAGVKPAVTIDEAVPAVGLAAARFDLDRADGGAQLILGAQARVRSMRGIALVLAAFVPSDELDRPRSPHRRTAGPPAVDRGTPPAARPRAS